MTVKDLIDKNWYKVINEGDETDREIGKVFCCDLLSIAMGKAPADCAWVTVMGNINTLAVEHGQLDACFSFKKSNRNSHLVFHQLNSSQFVCLMPPGHPLAQSSFIRMEEIRNEQQIWIVPMPLRNTFYNKSKSDVLQY